VPTVPATPIGISITSCPAHLPVVRAAVEKLCQLAGFDERAAAGVVVSVDEALANVIKHAYDGREGEPIELALRALTEGDRQAGIEVVLTDHGRTVDPETIRGRDLADVRPGGLGTHIMGACMDSVEYAHQQAGGTRLTMVKYLTERRACEPAPTTEVTGGE